MGSQLFESVSFRKVTLRNRIAISPMCQYSAVDGVATDWHFVHLGSRAIGGAGAVMVEATAVTPDGRISLGDMGLWNDAQTTALQRIAAFITLHGAVPAIQLAHAGRKASCALPWRGGAPIGAAQGGWPIVGPSAISFGDPYPVPRALSANDIAGIIAAFTESAQRAVRAGFDIVEIHAAHGYLLNSFYSPLANTRTDQYGGDFVNRTRLLCDVARAVRNVLGADRALWVRISASDWVDGGWTADDSIQLALTLKTIGVDLIDCSSGGMVPHAKIPAGPGYQVQFAEAVRRGAHMPTSAVGLINAPEQAEQIIRTGQADVVMIARESLRDPYWPLHAAKTLRADIDYWPEQYLRAK